MRNPRLDRSRDYGEIHPAGTEGVHYQQDGYPFDHEGRLVTARLTKEQIDELNGPEKPRAKAAPAAVSIDQLKVLDAAGLLTDEQKALFAEMKTRPSDKPKKHDGEDDGVNLELWLKGDNTYLFSRITTAVFERYKKKCTRLDDAVQFLVTDHDGPHLVSVAEVSDKFRGLISGQSAA